MARLRIDDDGRTIFDEVAIPFDDCDTTVELGLNSDSSDEVPEALDAWLWLLEMLE